MTIAIAWYFDNYIFGGFGVVGKPLDYTNTKVNTSSISDKSNSVAQEEQTCTYNEAT